MELSSTWISGFEPIFLSALKKSASSRTGFPREIGLKDYPTHHPNFHRLWTDDHRHSLTHHSKGVLRTDDSPNFLLFNRYSNLNSNLSFNLHSTAFPLCNFVPPLCSPCNWIFAFNFNGTDVYRSLTFHTYFQTDY